MLAGIDISITSNCINMKAMSEMVTIIETDWNLYMFSSDVNLPPQIFS